MKSIQLYKLLSEHAGIINRLAVQLYKGEIETEDALAKAKEEEKRMAEKIGNSK
jgi:hypothetical protein